MRGYVLNGENFRNFSAQVRKITPLKKNQEKILIAEAKKGKKYAKDKLVVSHLWLVVILANRFSLSNSSLTIFDLI